MTNFYENLLGGYGIETFFFQFKYLSYVQVVFVLTQICLIYIDTFNEKYLWKSENLKQHKYNLLIWQIFKPKALFLEKKRLLFHNRPVDFDESLL